MKTYEAKKITVSIDVKELNGFSVPDSAIGNFENHIGVVVTDKILEKIENIMSEEKIEFKQALVKAVDKIVYLYADESEV